MAIHVVELCQVSPSEGAANEQLLPLLHFDIPYISYHLMKNLIFYSFQCSESHFLDVIVPKLKNSLSLALKHFLPLAGKIVVPLNNCGMPVSQYVAGDSVPLTIALSNADFAHLTENHSRDADEFHDFVPQTLSSTCTSDFIKFSLLAVQVTLFPNQGISIGLIAQHTVADGASRIRFLQAWASINKFTGDDHLLALGEKVWPSYDRSVVQDANELTPTVWKLTKMNRPTVASTISLPTYKVRATFILSEAKIQKLKTFALNKKPDMVHISSFVIACGLVWSCITKSAAAQGEKVTDDEPEYLVCVADCRARLSPRLPNNYFGNCLAIMLPETTHGALKGNEGFVTAADAIAEAIHKINNSVEYLDGYNKWLKLTGKRQIAVSGSPRFDFYGLDYGWGRAEKFENISRDSNRSISLCKAREGRIEIGLSMSKVEMDAFAATFSQVLRETTENTYT